MEELEWGGRSGSCAQQRPLSDDELVYTAQVIQSFGFGTNLTVIEYHQWTWKPNYNNGKH